MMQKFPFGDSLMKDLVVLPLRTASYSVNTIFGLAKNFPQFNLADASSLDQLREELVDFQLSPADIPSLSMYEVADLTQKPRKFQVRS